jgi:hypothetical protein
MPTFFSVFTVFGLNILCQAKAWVALPPKHPSIRIPETVVKTRFPRAFLSSTGVHLRGLRSPVGKE